MKLNDILEQFGLTQRQARVYLATLELGESTIQNIAKQADIERTGTYHLIDSLIQAGLVSCIIKKKKNYYSAREPEVISNIAKSRAKLIDQYLPEFKALYNLSDSKPKVRLFEGMEGIKTIFERTLDLKKGEEILAFSSFNIAHRYISEWGHDYVKRRAAKGIFARDITEDSLEAKEHQSRDKEELRETRMVPKDRFPFTNEINIYRNIVIIISYREMIGLVIESEDIAKMLKTIFELSWLGAKEASQDFYSTNIFEKWLKKASPAIQDWFKEENKYLLKQMKPRYSILDVGCGFGRHIKILAPVVKEVVGIDKNPSMVEKAKRELAEHKNVKFLTRDAQNTRLKANSFDLVICMTNTFGNFINTKLKSLSEMARVLKPNGKIIISVYSEKALDTRITDYKNVGLHIEAIENGRIYTDEGLISEQFTKKDLTELFNRAKLKVTIKQLTPFDYLCEARKL